ncbi:MAG TPA: hypothetical protein VMB03_30375 [Bryobacteraceae bacterium]|nr:hypothetical protein [Bryobacteraceae bacterium]
MSRSYTLRTFVLCALALALLTGTASAQTIVAGTTTINFAYSKGLAAPAQQTSAISDSGTGDTFGVGVVYNPTGSSWLTLGCTTSCAIPSSLTLNVNTGAAGSLSAGSYAATVTLTDSNDSSTATIAVNLTVSILPIGANGGTSSNSPVSFNFTKGSTTANQTVTVEDAATSTNTYTVGTPSYGSGPTGWLTATSGTGIADGDTLTLAVVPSALASTAAGAYTATVLLTDVDTSTTTVYVKVTVGSPLSASSPTLSLTYSQGTGNGSQPAAQYVLAVTSSDATADSYTLTKSAGCPAWFSATSASGSASSSASDTLTMAITSAAGSLGLPVTPVTTCTVALKYQGVAFATVTFSSLNVVGVALSSSASSIALTYTKGGGGTNSGSTNITSTIVGGLAFAANVATVPGWLTLSPSGGTATASNTAVSFALNTAVTATMAVGNYNASVHFQATGYADLVVAVSLGISNAGATMSIKEGASGNTVIGYYAMGATQPAPTVTPYSSDEPLPFTASCAVGVQNSTYTPTATSCQLNGGSATLGSPLTGVAYTWGYPLAVTLDQALFAFPVGTIVTVTVTVTPTGGASNTPLTLAYQYTAVMPDPTFATSSAVVPTSVAQQTVAGTSMVVLLNGSNFVGPQSIVGDVVSPTLVFLAGSNTPVSSSQVTVVSSNQIMLTIPQTSFPTIGTGKSSVNLAIGVANQTGATVPSQAKVSTNLVVTNAPVIYAITSTASYNNPGLGVAPSLAPFELVSIFGDNFGYSTLNPNFQTASVNAQDQVPTSLLITTTGTGTSAKSTYLSVTFKDATGKTAVTYAAPILFANQNQINAIVPSNLTVGHTVSVIVTSGASTNVSDGLYTVGIVGNDPGIFTVASDGTGPGAILNVNSSTGALTVNSASNKTTAGQAVAIYMTGLGVPDSTHPDVALTAADTPAFPTDCSAISLTTSANSPGYMQVGNTAKATIAGWTAPSTAWTSIDGAVIQGELLKSNILAPCMVDPIVVTFGTGSSAKTASVANGGVTWAGFAAGSIAGLYQINVTIPGGVTTGSAVPVTVTITPSATGYTSQAGVTIAIQ